MQLPLLILAIVGVAVLLLIGRRRLMLLLLRASMRSVLSDVGKRAMAKQPDQIHLVRGDSYVWKNEPAIQALTESLCSLGIAEVGTYAIDTLPDVMVRFLLREEENVYAIVYEHAKAGVWINFVFLFQDGTSVTYTTSRDRGLEKRPGHAIIYSPGSAPEELYRRALGELPPKTLKVLSPESIVREFETAWNERIQWRKRKGLSVREVSNVIQTRSTAQTRRFGASEIEFLGEQDGVQERALKKSLAKLFNEHGGVDRAYLARVRHRLSGEEREEVALCVAPPGGADMSLVGKVSRLFRSTFRQGEHLDIMLVREDQEARLKKVCSAFYTQAP